MTEDRITELEEIICPTWTGDLNNKEKQTLKNKQSLRDLKDYEKNQHFFHQSPRKREESGVHCVLEEEITENFPNLMTHTNI